MIGVLCVTINLFAQAQWFMGDTLNLLGCLITGTQLATTTALACYFLISDMVMLSQVITSHTLA